MNKIKVKAKISLLLITFLFSSIMPVIINAAPPPEHQNTTYYLVSMPKYKSDWFHNWSGTPSSPIIAQQQSDRAVYGYNHIFGLSQSNTSVLFTNMFGTYSVSQNGAHEGIDMVYGSPPNNSNIYDVHNVGGGNIIGRSTSEGRIAIHHTGQYQTAIYRHMSGITSSTPAGRSSGDIIGKQSNVDSPGGTHVHFEVCWGQNQYGYTAKNEHNLDSTCPYTFIYNTCM